MRAIGPLFKTLPDGAAAPATYLRYLPIGTVSHTQRVDNGRLRSRFRQESHIELAVVDRREHGVVIRDEATFFQRKVMAENLHLTFHQDMKYPAIGLLVGDLGKTQVNLIDTARYVIESVLENSLA